jgi:hypothetical protein
MRLVILTVAISFIATTCHAAISLHTGLADPVTEGWTKFRPFSSVDTFPVANDLGLGIDSWSIDDNAGFGPPGHDGVYGQLLTPAQILSVESLGWRYSVRMRIVDSELGLTHDSIMASVIDSTHTYTMQFGRTAAGNPLVMVTTGEDIGPTFEVSDPNNGYHLYELLFSAQSNSASLLVDGILQTTGYTGRLGADLGTGLGATGNINFGSTSNNFTGQANYASVAFDAVPEPSGFFIGVGTLTTLCVATLLRRSSRPKLVLLGRD